MYKVFNCRNNNAKYEAKQFILTIWSNEYPVHFAIKNLQGLENYLQSLTKATHYFVIYKRSNIAWSTSFDRENARWFAIMVNKKYQKQGIGKMLMKQLMNVNNTLYGWIIKIIPR